MWAFSADEDILSICTCIAEFAMGFIVKCCNNYDNCTNEVSLDNKYDFNRKRLTENDDIYWYEPYTYYDVKPAVTIWGEWYRIFCSDCNKYKLKECRKCYNRECPDLSKEGVPICCDHDLCEECGNLQNTESNCGLCDGAYCKRCSVKIGNRCYDKPCALQKSFANLSKYILEALQYIDPAFGTKIAECLATFADGYVAECCNEVIGCNNSIYIDNIWKLKLKKD